MHLLQQAERFIAGMLEAFLRQNPHLKGSVTQHSSRVYGDPPYFRLHLCYKYNDVIHRDRPSYTDQGTACLAQLTDTERQVLETFAASITAATTSLVSDGSYSRQGRYVFILQPTKQAPRLPYPSRSATSPT